MKSNILKLKEEIKSQVVNQRITKQNRKTVHFTGTRRLQPSEATFKAISNKYKLRHMYLAYGLLRGKDPAVVDKNHEQCNRLYVDKIMTEYAPQEEPVRVDQE